MAQDKQIIKKLAEEFTEQTFGTEIPDGYCFLTCFPFSILLDIKQIWYSITCGISPKGNNRVPHVWLTIDNQGTILDPTIRQFDCNMESVYLGKLTENEVTKKYTHVKQSFEEWFKSSYGIWTEPLINKQSRTFPRPPGFDDKMNLLNVKTATVLYGYIEKMYSKEDFIQKDKCKSYFSPIFKFLRDKSNIDKDFPHSLCESMPNGFDALLSRALSAN